MGRLKAVQSRLTTSLDRLQVIRITSSKTGREILHRRSNSWNKTYKWQQLRLRILKRDGLTCQQTGVLLVGKYPAPNSPVVDHIIPHRGDAALFWEEGNLQSVSKEYHDRVKQAQEKRGEY